MYAENGCDYDLERKYLILMTDYKCVPTAKLHRQFINTTSAKKVCVNNLCS